MLGSSSRSRVARCATAIAATTGGMLALSSLHGLSPQEMPLDGFVLAVALRVAAISVLATVLVLCLDPGRLLERSARRQRARVAPPALARHSAPSSA